VDKTAKKIGTVGDLWDQSAELSKMREDKYGVDKVKEKFEENHKKKRKGKNTLKKDSIPF
jgi:hypothetical protein